MNDIGIIMEDVKVMSTSHACASTINTSTNVLLMDFEVTFWYIIKLLVVIFHMLIEVEPHLNKCCKAHFEKPTQYSTSLDCINLPPFPGWPDFSNNAEVIQYTKVDYCHTMY